MNTSADVKQAKSWDEAIRLLMELRDGGFWSFRGQRLHTWDLGIHHPDNLTESDLKRGFAQFRKRCLEFSKPAYIDENHKWRWLFYAQHYRLWTRLLDWTSNPLVALYFAVENILTDKSILDQNPLGAVWAVRVRRHDFRTEEELPKDPEQEKRWIMINPPPITNRILKQSGKFSFHPEPDDKPLNLLQSDDQED